jgi:hypothetical protein
VQIYFYFVFTIVVKLPSLPGREESSGVRRVTIGGGRGRLCIQPTDQFNSLADHLFQKQIILNHYGSP